MAKRRTPEEILLDNFLSKTTPNTWYTIAGRSDYEKLVKQIKALIDEGHDLEFSNDYKMVKRIDIDYCKSGEYKQRIGNIILTF